VSPRQGKSPGFWRRNGLSLTLFAMFVVLLAGQLLAGWLDHNNELASHGAPPEAFAEYARSGDVLEVTAENWESEFLQMFIYVVFTVFLYQRGSSESKPLDQPSEVDEDPRRHRDRADAPLPVRRGGWMLALYERSLSLALLALFLASFLLHALGGQAAYNAEQREHGGKTQSLAQYVTGARFWFESLQNWQSEFLAIGSMVVLSIYLRQRGSPESKPVAAAHTDTGSG
jgi:hypothetical protein